MLQRVISYTDTRLSYDVIIIIHPFDCLYICFIYLIQLYSMCAILFYFKCEYLQFISFIYAKYFIHIG